MLFKRFVMSLTTIQFRACPACWTWVEGRVRMCIPVNLVPPSSHRDSQTLSCEIYFRKHKITFGNNDLAHVVEILHGVKDKDPFIMHSQCHGCWHIEAKTKWLPFHRQRFQMHCLNENVKIWIQISLKFVLKGLITIIPALVWIMAWHRPGNKPLSELMMVKSLTHIYVTRPQWVNDWVTQGAGASWATLLTCFSGIFRFQHLKGSQSMMLDKLFLHNLFHLICYKTDVSDQMRVCQLFATVYDIFNDISLIRLFKMFYYLCMLLASVLLYGYTSFQNKLYIIEFNNFIATLTFLF